MKRESFSIFYSKLGLVIIHDFEAISMHDLALGFTSRDGCLLFFLCLNIDRITPKTGHLLLRWLQHLSLRYFFRHLFFPTLFLVFFISVASCNGISMNFHDYNDGFSCHFTENSYRNSLSMEVCIPYFYHMHPSIDPNLLGDIVLIFIFSFQFFAYR